MSLYLLVAVTPTGYVPKESFEAGDLREAAAKHVAAYRKRKSPFALVLRGSDGRRYSVHDSETLLFSPSPAKESEKV